MDVKSITKIFIKGNVPSSKNSKVWTGKFLVNSKTVTKYKKETKADYLANRDKFLEMIKDLDKPYKIAFKFVRNSRRKFDYVNPLQTVQDLMVEYDWLEDDNANILLPVFKTFEYNKEMSGVYIFVA